MTVADPAGDAPAAGDRDGLPRRGFRRLAEQGPGLLEGPVPSQSPCLQPLTPVRAHLRQAMTSSSYAGNPRFGYGLLCEPISTLMTPSSRKLWLQAASRPRRPSLRKLSVVWSIRSG